MAPRPHWSEAYRSLATSSPDLRAEVEAFQAWAAGIADARTAWQRCDRADWMLNAMRGRGVHARSRVGCMCDCLQSAVRFLPDRDTWPHRGLEIARRWATGFRKPDREAIRKAARGVQFTAAPRRASRAAISGIHAVLIEIQALEHPRFFPRTPPTRWAWNAAYHAGEAEAHHAGLRAADGARALALAQGAARMRARSWPLRRPGAVAARTWMRRVRRSRWPGIEPGNTLGPPPPSTSWSPCPSRPCWRARSAAPIPTNKASSR